MSATTSVKAHCELAKRFFNEAWELLEKPDRSPSDNLWMIHLAHASRVHWEYAGEAKNHNIGEWQISRVYSVLGYKEQALYHAQNCLHIALEYSLKPFLLAYSYEAVARAYAIADNQVAREFLAKAESAFKHIDTVDRIRLGADIARLEADIAAIKNLIQNP